MDNSASLSELYCDNSTHCNRTDEHNRHRYTKTFLLLLPLWKTARLLYTSSNKYWMANISCYIVSTLTRFFCVSILLLRRTKLSRVLLKTAPRLEKPHHLLLPGTIQRRRELKLYAMFILCNSGYGNTIELCIGIFTNVYQSLQISRKSEQAFFFKMYLFKKELRQSLSLVLRSVQFSLWGLKSE